MKARMGRSNGPPSYQYKPLLTPDSIRLLHIGHDETKPHNLRLLLREVRLDSDSDSDSDPQFCTLSYTWKSPVYTASETPTPEIHYEVDCDGATATVSSNLFCFFQTVLSLLHLPQLSKPPPPQKRKGKWSRSNTELLTLPIWIDALCINQSDPAERQSQVLLMHRIYSRSQHLFVFLSPLALEASSSVLFVHDTFIPALSRLPWEFATRHMVRDPLCESRPVVERIGTAVCSRWAASWLGYANFLDKHRWFDRGWVVQEVALRKGDGISVLCGQTELSWTRMAAFATFLDHSGWAVSLRKTLESRLAHRLVRSGPMMEAVLEKRPIGWKIKIMEDIRRMIRMSSRELSRSGNMRGEADSEDAMMLWALEASSLVRLLRSSQFEDRRDHIYGAVGMLSQLLPEGMKSPVTPDYTKTTAEVFTSVAATFISSTKSLLELSQVEDRSHSRYHGLRLPSWVPDYSVYPGNSHVRSLSEVDFYRSLSHHTGSAQISDTRQNSLNPSVDGPKLTVHGILVDTRAEATLRPRSDRGGPYDTPYFLNDLLNLLLATSALHSTALAHDFFSALTHGHPERFFRNPDTCNPVDRFYTNPFSDLFAEPGDNAKTGIGRGSARAKYGVPLSAFEVAEHFDIPQPIPLASLARQYHPQVGDESQERHVRYSRDGKVLYSWPKASLPKNSTPTGFDYDKFMSFLKVKRDVIEAQIALRALVQVDPVAPRIGTEELQVEVWDVLRHGMLVATEKGKLCMGPRCSEKGDEIWLLAGARAPVLLRRIRGAERDGEYQFVGEVFVQGLDTERQFGEEEGRIQTVVLV